MTFESILRNSLIYRRLTGMGRLAAGPGSDSCAWRLISSTPRYASAEFMEGSLVSGLASGLIKRVLTAPGALMRRWVPGSLLLNLEAPPVLAESQVLKAAAGIRVETALWLVILYPVIDFLLRLEPSLGFLSRNWDELLLLFVIAAWPLQMAVRGKIMYRYSGLDLPVLVFAGVILFLFFMRSQNTSIAMEGARIYLEYLLWFFVGSNLMLNRRQFDALVKGIVAVATLVALVGLYQYAAGVETPAHWVDQAEAGIRTRVFSIVVSPNVLGSLLLIFIPVTLGGLLTARGWWNRSAYLAGLAVMLPCMIFTYSRGPWLALGISIMVFSLMYNPRLLVAVAAGSLAAAQLVPGISARLSYMLSPAYLASSAKAGRLALWQIGLNKFLQDPIFGSGFGSFGGAVAARRIPGSFYVDNFYLKTAVESGIIGILALLWLLAGALRCGYAAYRQIKEPRLKIMAAAILTGLLGVILHNTVENIFEVPLMATYFWLMAGILVSLPHIED